MRSAARRAGHVEGTEPERVAEVFDEVGLTYLNAAVFHPGFRHAGPPRRQLGISTVFNILGPLCNPARPEASAVGVASLDRVPPSACCRRSTWCSTRRAPA